MKTLKDVKIGGRATVVKVHGEGPIRRRIMDMGITKGVEIYVRKTAPLGDPLELNLRGYELSLRKSDAEMIEVANSGALVPNATMVKPITSAGIRSFAATPDAPSTNQSAPLIKATNPTSKSASAQTTSQNIILYTP